MATENGTPYERLIDDFREQLEKLYNNEGLPNKGNDGGDYLFSEFISMLDFFVVVRQLECIAFKYPIRRSSLTSHVRKSNEAKGQQPNQGGPGKQAEKEGLGESLTTGEGRPRLGESLSADEDLFRLSQKPHLAFASSAIDSFTIRTNSKNWQLPPVLEIYFHGLFGPNGALPTHLTEYALDLTGWQREQQQDDNKQASGEVFRRFADVFQHRMLSLLYRAWATAQPTVSFDRRNVLTSERTKQDRFSDYLASLIGIGTEAVRTGDAMPDSAKFHFAGRLLSPVRNPEGLRAIIADYFQLALAVKRSLPVQIREFTGTWLDVPTHHQTALGESPDRATLGAGALVGDSVRDCQHRFSIELGPLHLDDYQRFLPGHDRYRTLKAIIRNYVGDELDWDLRLALCPEDARGPVLGGLGQLGLFDAWLGETGNNTPGGIASEAKQVSFGGDRSAAWELPFHQSQLATFIDREDLRGHQVDDRLTDFLARKPIERRLNIQLSKFEFKDDQFWVAGEEELALPVGSRPRFHVIDPPSQIDISDKEKLRRSCHVGPPSEYCEPQFCWFSSLTPRCLRWSTKPRLLPPAARRKNCPDQLALSWREFRRIRQAIHQWALSGRFRSLVFKSHRELKAKRRPAMPSQSRTPSRIRGRIRIVMLATRRARENRAQWQNRYRRDAQSLMKAVPFQSSSFGLDYATAEGCSSLKVSAVSFSNSPDRPSGMGSPPSVRRLATIFPYEDRMRRLFATTSPLEGDREALRNYANVELLRWVNPKHVCVLLPFKPLPMSQRTLTGTTLRTNRATDSPQFWRVAWRGETGFHAVNQIQCREFAQDAAVLVLRLPPSIYVSTPEEEFETAFVGKTLLMPNGDVDSEDWTETHDPNAAVIDSDRVGSYRRMQPDDVMPNQTGKTLDSKRVPVLEGREGTTIVPVYPANRSARELFLSVAPTQGKVEQLKRFPNLDWVRWISTSSVGPDPTNH